jgi:dextranase
VELVPAKATFAPGESIEVELRGAAEPAPVRLLRLDHVVAETVAAETAVFPPQPPGGYGLEAAGATGAIDVLADPCDRLRYGFLTDFSPGRSPNGAVDTVRRLHLNAVQFYDWMYRHARLLPPADVFEDALGRGLSLETVRRLAAAVRGVGSLPMGYAAVYAVGRDERQDWGDAELRRANGEPWKLGDDFLTVVDPTNARWLAHLGAELARARDEVGFAGFQLDQYGWPKRAFRTDGSVVDLAAAFPALVDLLAAELPGTRLVFNNVNDFPTWATTGASVDAVYVEVWAPHTGLADLASVIVRAHGLAPRKSVVVAAYLPTFTQTGQDILLATVFSHGATAILHGEVDAVLTDPYFVRHGELGDDGFETTRRYYDFAVRYGDLLFDRDAIDLSGTHVGGINEEIVVDAAVPVSVTPEPGALWVRALELEGGLLLSLIDLSDQSDVEWASPKQPGSSLAGVRVRIERRGRRPTRFFFADPDAPALVELAAVEELPRDAAELPAFTTWAIVWSPDV